MNHKLPVLKVFWAGQVPLSSAVALMNSAINSIKNAGPDQVFLLEHPHVFTLGRRGHRTDVLANDLELRALGVEVIEVDRGGQATYHGPGQLVVYPIINARVAQLGPVAWVRILEESVMSVLAGLSIKGHRVVGKTGVWVGGEPGKKVANGQAPAGRKIASIGIRMEDGITKHGLAVNVRTDMDMYKYIVPCGMAGLEVTSVYKELGTAPSLRVFGQEIVSSLADIMGRELVWQKSEALELG